MQSSKNTDTVAVKRCYFTDGKNNRSFSYFSIDASILAKTKAVQDVLGLKTYFKQRNHELHKHLTMVILSSLLRTRRNQSLCFSKHRFPFTRQHFASIWLDVQEKTVQKFKNKASTCLCMSFACQSVGNLQVFFSSPKV